MLPLLTRRALRRAPQARFLLDYTAENGWCARATAPAGWDAALGAECANVVCERAESATCRHFRRRHCVVIFDYTPAGWAQAVLEDADDPTRLACPLCNPPT